MANKTTLSILFFFSSLQCLSSIGLVHSRLVPALYVFGDSLVDVGNNIFLRGATTIPNYRPYAIDFPNGTFGRFTNGFTIADYLAKSLGLPIPPPILDPHIQTTNCTGGFNYGSSSAGILPDTGAKMGANLCLGRQVELFRKIAQEFLLSRLRNQHVVEQHLQNSIFFIMIGSNDYSLNYFNPILSNNSHIYNPEQFAELLANELGHQLQELYKFGARKFVVSEIGLVGCTPAAIKKLAPTTRCAEQLNVVVSIYNTKLANKRTQLSKILEGAKFVTMKGDAAADLIENPKRYGFKDAVNPCCTIGKEIECARDVPPCQKRRSFVFWDDAHPSDATNKKLAKACFKSIGACTPINIRELVLGLSHLTCPTTTHLLCYHYPPNSSAVQDSLNCKLD